MASFSGVKAMILGFDHGLETLILKRHFASPYLRMEQWWYPWERTRQSLTAESTYLLVTFIALYIL